MWFIWLYVVTLLPTLHQHYLIFMMLYLKTLQAFDLILDMRKMGIRIKVECTNDIKLRTFAKLPKYKLYCLFTKPVFREQNAVECTINIKMRTVAKLQTSELGLHSRALSRKINSNILDTEKQLKNWSSKFLLCTKVWWLLLIHAICNHSLPMNYFLTYWSAWGIRISQSGRLISANQAGKAFVIKHAFGIVSGI